MHACCSQAFSLRRCTCCTLHSGPPAASFSPYLPLDFCATRLSTFAPPEFDVVCEARQASILTSACQSICGHGCASTHKLNTFSLDKNRHIVAFRVDDGVSWTGRAKSVLEQSTEQTCTRMQAVSHTRALPHWISSARSLKLTFDDEAEAPGLRTLVPDLSKPPAKEASASPLSVTTAHDCFSTQPPTRARPPGASECACLGLAR